MVEAPAKEVLVVSQSQPRQQQQQQQQPEHRRTSSLVSTCSSTNSVRGMTTDASLSDMKSLNGATVASIVSSLPPPPSVVADKRRAVHRINVSALSHNFTCVRQAASSKQCDVICVVKADGYGHGAAATALHLADTAGAQAFAVATLEEAIALRKAFEKNPPGSTLKQLRLSQQSSQFPFPNNSKPPTAPASLQNPFAKKNTTMMNGGAGTASISSAPSSTGAPLATLFPQQQQSLGSGPPAVVQAPSASSSGAVPAAIDVISVPDNYSLGGSTTGSTGAVAPAMRPCVRPAQIRILVLGSPVGYPRCFDDYYHHNIEVMVSGPEVAMALMDWVADANERKRTQVERAAMEAKEQALLHPVMRSQNSNTGMNNGNGMSSTTTNGDSQAKGNATPGGVSGSVTPSKSLPHPSSTLGNVSGQDLANEVRALLLNQYAAKAAREFKPLSYTTSNVTDGNSSDNNSVASSNGGQATTTTAVTGTAVVVQPGGVVAENRNESMTTLNGSVAGASTGNGAARKRLRWHALVDSGMGRLGFKTEPVSQDEEETTGARDTVDIIQELVQAQWNANAPIEFFGMCTHMADANNVLSDYTESQTKRFAGLLDRVRAAQIAIPTVSIDNSAALMSTSYKHFEPERLLSQPGLGEPSRGFARVGGAIYGQRPAFPQLKPVSTFVASVRHVSIIRKGESVGYDRAFIAEYDVRVATLTVGFADGYPRDLGNGVGKVSIRGALFPIAGNVCMDMLMCLLGRADDKNSVGASIMVGDRAVLWGPPTAEDEGFVVTLAGDDEYLGLSLDTPGDDFDLETASFDLAPLAPQQQQEGKGAEDVVEAKPRERGWVRLQDIAATLNTTQSALTCGLNARVEREYV